MHIYFAGIGGSGMSSLALLAAQAGYNVSGSDSSHSAYIDYLKKHGIENIHIGQNHEQIAKVHAEKPIDWLLYSPALPMTNPNHPELSFAKEAGIKASREDDFVVFILKKHELNLIAVAGTHGKSTTTAMAIWLFKQLRLPISYSFGGKLSFGDSGEFDKQSDYFVLEADEFDRKFLSFYPKVALISGLDYDHPDIYPTRLSYDDAFREFFAQSNKVVLWRSDAQKILPQAEEKYLVLDDTDPSIESIKLPGRVNRLDAWLVAQGLADITGRSEDELIKILEDFPGLSRRFERITDGLYSDYAHTPPKIRGALQLAHEVGGENVVVVYEGLHNTRQHFIKEELKDLFQGIKELYVVPSYLAREDSNLELLTPDKLIDLLSNSIRNKAHAAQLDDELKDSIRRHLGAGDLVLCLSAGGGGSLDEWLRKEFK